MASPAGLGLLLHQQPPVQTAAKQPEAAEGMALHRGGLAGGQPQAAVQLPQRAVEGPAGGRLQPMPQGWKAAKSPWTAAKSPAAEEGRGSRQWRPR